MNEELKNILEKVHCLYQKYGIKSVTMDDIAKELGISKKTLYTHVKDKRELVEKISDLLIETAKCHGKHLQENNLNAIEELIFVYKNINKQINDHNPSLIFDLKKYYPDIFEKVHEIKRKEAYEGMIQNMKKGQLEGFYRTDINCEIIAKLHVSRFESITDSDLFTKSDFQSLDIFKEIFKYHLRGIANNKGLEYFEQKLNEDKD